MSNFIESGYTSLIKKGEELCGDKVEIINTPTHMTLVLADGLGSGVKANILATLTSKILATMISKNISISECVETILLSLPVCKERGIAYATFTIIHVNQEGDGYLFEFDNPQSFYIRDHKTYDFERFAMEVLDRTVYYSEFNLRLNDIIMTMSDGAIYAGVGETFNFGWQMPEIKDYVVNVCDPDNMSARSMANQLAQACYSLYGTHPGDDTTIAAIKLRPLLKVNVMVGPPVDKQYDGYYISKFMSSGQKKIVCGGTTSQIVARYLKTEVVSTLDIIDPLVPPIGKIDGIDLVTEGVLTLSKVLEYSNTYVSSLDLTSKTYTNLDGASQLAHILLEEATEVDFYVGQSINPAHQGLSIQHNRKISLIEELSKNLKLLGKKVNIYYQ
jgi:hypothetical protein